MTLPNLTSVEIKRIIKSIPGQIIYSIRSTRLTTLELYNLAYIPEESILALLNSCSSSLETINLPGNSNITDIVLLKIFQKFGNSLKSLNLCRTNITGGILSKFTVSLPVITELKFGQCYQLTDTGLINLLQLSKQTLVYMDINGSRITGENLIEINGTLPCLENFYFFECRQLTELNQLLQLCGNTLKHLDLTETAITGEGLMEKDITLPCLEVLKLVGCDNLTDEGLVEFLQACRNTIKILDISCTPITGESMDDLEVRHVN